MTNEEGELGWLNIAVTLGPTRFSRHVTHTAVMGAGNVDRKPKKDGYEKSSLHQQSCGKGYRQEPAHPWNGVITKHTDSDGDEPALNHNCKSKSILGASPYEMDNYRPVNRYAGRYKTFSVK